MTVYIYIIQLPTGAILSLDAGIDSGMDAWSNQSESRELGRSHQEEILSFHWTGTWSCQEAACQEGLPAPEAKWREADPRDEGRPRPEDITRGTGLFKSVQRSIYL